MELPKDSVFSLLINSTLRAHSKQPIQFFCSNCRKPRSRRFHRQYTSITSTRPNICSRKECREAKESIAKDLPGLGYALVSYWVPLQHKADLEALQHTADLKAPIPELPTQFTQRLRFEADSRVLNRTELASPGRTVL
ncbi:hypothetical protein GQ44DRAFT_734220 [Phaeosphaeriaceae sp. PMI808]|nr:hypothetical protein GQ44DRAFT_734220 [Phaeosphaeriaceae sp. PMI808]